MRRIRLNTKGDLDGYLFSDNEHARNWLRQIFVQAPEYMVSIVDAEEKRKCPHCGKVDHRIKVITTMRPEQFLQMSDSEIAELSLTR